MRAGMKKALIVFVLLTSVLFNTPPAYAGGAGADLVFNPPGSDIRLVLVKPHVGTVPGRGNVLHTNFHVYSISRGRDIKNYHIVQQPQNCLYIYEGVNSQVI